MKRCPGIRTLALLLAVCGMGMSLGGCKEKEEKTKTIITSNVERKVSDTPKRMQSYTQTEDVEWIGKKTYKCEIHRAPDDSLDVVEDDRGQKFIDNSITVTVTRSDGSVFYHDTFTKTSFASYLSDEYKKGGILEGLVFDKADGSALIFAASVCLPQTDECVPFVISLSKMGKVTMAIAAELDTSSYDEDTY